jgi:DNA-directed RNA polymerase subunit beta'
VPQSRHLTVRDGEQVKAGDALTDGSLSPHDILAIRGEKAVQEFLLSEVQEVYRLQGVNINDKHIEGIIRQMLKKVVIEDVGTTRFLIGQQVDKHEFLTENARVKEKGGQPATAKPRLLGLTKASLETDSFISAASFQETTRVLTDAAVRGRIDRLVGLKENVIMGLLIPAGTGLPQYRHTEVVPQGALNILSSLTEGASDAQYSGYASFGGNDNDDDDDLGGSSLRSRFDEKSPAWARTPLGEAAEGDDDDAESFGSGFTITESDDDEE